MIALYFLGWALAGGAAGNMGLFGPWIPNWLHGFALGAGVGLVLSVSWPLLFAVFLFELGVGIVEWFRQ